MGAGMRQVDKLLTPISHCNSAVINQNDYLISAAIIRRIVKDEDLSIEQISEEACISQATVSRFVKRAGFESWHQFRECCVGAHHEIGQRRYATNSIEWQHDWFTWSQSFYRFVTEIAFK